MKPRVLFVSRERFRLPLDGAQQRKWDAVGEVVDHRVLAAAPRRARRRATRASSSSARRAPRLLDGALYYLALPVADRARAARASGPTRRSSRASTRRSAFLVARRVAAAAHEGDPRRPGRLARGDAPVRLAAAAAAQPAQRRDRRESSVRRVDADPDACRRSSRAPSCAALGVEPAAEFPPFVDADAFLDRPPAPLPDVPRALFVGVLERYKAFDTLATAWPRVARARAGRRRCTSSARDARDRSPRALVDRAAQTSGRERSTPRSVSAAMDASWLLCLPSRSEGLGARRARGDVPRPRVVGGTRGGIPDSSHDGENGLLVDPDDAGALADALVRDPRRPAEARAARRRRPAHRRGVGRHAGSSTRRGSLRSSAGVARPV